MLARLGVPPGARTEARAAGSASRAEHLIDTGRLSAEVWWPALADALGLAYEAAPTVPPAEDDAVLPAPEAFMRARQILVPGPDGRARLLLAPRGREIGYLAARLAQDPGLAARIRIASPKTIRAAVAEHHAAALTRRATRHLAERRPALSAARTKLPGGWTAAVAVLTATAVAALGGSTPLLLAIGLLECAFLAQGVVRLGAARERPRDPEPPALPDADLPRYAVLVPLHREVAVVPRLVQGLLRLDYPAGKLAIRIVVEADDGPTRAAVEAAIAGTPIERVVVPPSKPRTKPKALNYALALVDADLVAVYDAEDQPEPDQLRKAAAAFAAGPADLVCVQAALAIDNAGASRTWLARQFALEYAMLFDGLLPALAGRGLLFLLGGTSNHFRREALARAGAWDPYNVTEDADIAVRLVREGGRLGVIASSTAEEAPVHHSAWMAQRTRWMKGWIQTWLVHMRYPRRLRADLGWRDFLMLQVLLPGQILSALLYPVGLATLALALADASATFADRSFAADLLLALCLVGHATGLAGAVLLAARVRDRMRSPASWLDVLTMPLYWPLLMLAVLAAFRELGRAPHRWNKTEHGLAERDTPLAEPPPGALSVGSTRV
ncbi:glycosyltransferase [Prosthecomicrobium sp. N25]|uniref:glycosyltransferase n=1 Tax=Prosthecomicrobium sp. N25 TaxID=3129254 RepID=UPI003077C574